MLTQETVVVVVVLVVVLVVVVVVVVVVVSSSSRTRTSSSRTRSRSRSSRSLSVTSLQFIGSQCGEICCFFSQHQKNHTPFHIVIWLLWLQKCTSYLQSSLTDHWKVLVWTCHEMKQWITQSMYPLSLPSNLHEV